MGIQNEPSNLGARFVIVFRQDVPHIHPFGPGEDERDRAVVYLDRAQNQWSETYLALVEIGFGPESMAARRLALHRAHLRQAERYARWHKLEHREDPPFARRDEPRYTLDDLRRAYYAGMNPTDLEPLAGEPPKEGAPVNDDSPRTSEHAGAHGLRAVREPLPAADPTSARIVALAKRAASWVFRPSVTIPVAAISDGRMLHVYADGKAGVAGSIVWEEREARGENPVMSCALTPENAASESTLLRALVASKVRTADQGTHFTAELYDVRAIGSTEAGARDTLLDALFSAEPDRG